MIKIENEALFKSKLVSGISIFAGSGFSVLTSPSGVILPTGSELSSEVIKQFNLPEMSSDDGLDYISEFCAENEYQMFLRDKFTLNDYNPLYDKLNNISLKIFVTTNIDNIIQLVTDNSQRYYLKNIRKEGACSNRPNELVYIPLHGNVLDESSRLYFGKFELSRVRDDNSDLFDAMYGYLSTTPILFWGYSFNDSGVLSVVTKLIEKNHNDIWIQVLHKDNKSKKLFQAKGCNIIEADTKELLEWIGQNCAGDKPQSVSILEDAALSKYKIPSVSQVAKIPANDYYQKGDTDWAPIINRIPYERGLLAEIENKVLEGNNVIISGAHFSGKTTLLMQLAQKISSTNILYINSITKNEAEFIIKRIGSKETWVLFNNCCSDIDAFIALARITNIKLVGTADDYLLETVKHLLAINISYKIVDCTNIAQNEAMNMYNNVPSGIRKPIFIYKDDENEKYTMFEFVSSNIENAYTQQYISRILSELKKNDYEVFVTIMAASYFSRNNSAISYQNIANLLNIPIDPDAVNVVERATNYLRAYDIDLSRDEAQIPFYILRSKIFIQTASMVLADKFRNDYAKLIEDVVTRVNPYTILRYDNFRRKAFDSQLFQSLFTLDRAVYLYDILYKKDENPYTLQQLSLCQSLFGDHDNAFINIDKALSIKPWNFSFKNSQAIIMFEANYRTHNPRAIDFMKKAMGILEECYLNDKRKLYHAQKYAEFSIIMAKKYDCNDYLERAREWLVQMTDDTPDSSKTKRLKEQLASLLSYR